MIFFFLIQHSDKRTKLLNVVVWDFLGFFVKEEQIEKKQIQICHTIS